MTKPTRILVVGASGKLGAKVVSELLALGASLRVTHRNTTKAEQIEKLRAQGVELVAADLADAASLETACANVDVVVSAVQGLRATIVDGQTRLLRAAEKTGVTRLIPSDYALDFYRTNEGDNRNCDLRREFNRVLDASNVRGTSVLCGTFMDLIAYGAIGPDPKSGVFKVFGDENQPYDFTHTDDLAKYVAVIALDADAPRVVRVAGDTLSPRQLAATFQAARGTPVTIEQAGSIADLDQLIAQLRADDEEPTNPFPRWQQLQYRRDIASGRGKLATIDNARYPTVHPKTVRDLLGSARS